MTPLEQSQTDTAALREEGLLGLDEAICPSCRLAFFVSPNATDWGVCPDCLKAALERLDPDLVLS